MINLLQEKLEEVEKLRNYTKQILSLSFKTDFEKINIMINNRQKYELIIYSIDEKIKKFNSESNEKFNENSMITDRLKNDIRESVNQTIIMDKEIRNKLNNELKSMKEIMNEPEKTSKLNIKI
jgi:hypothetical protein